MNIAPWKTKNRGNLNPSLNLFSNCSNFFSKKYSQLEHRKNWRQSLDPLFKSCR